MPTKTFEVVALPFEYGEDVFPSLPSLLGGARSFVIKVKAWTISNMPGPFQGQLDYWDEQERFRSDTFFDSIEVAASGRSAFTPKIRFRSLSGTGQIIKGTWTIGSR